jgi:hypothetical protein
MAGENMTTHTATIQSPDTLVPLGRAVDASGTPGTTCYGVTMQELKVGVPGLVARSGPCQIEAADASMAVGDEVELDANGRAVKFDAGSAIGVAEEAGAAAVSGEYKLIAIDLYQDK